jgi:hypothetical protein
MRPSGCCDRPIGPPTASPTPSSPGCRPTGHGLAGPGGHRPAAGRARRRQGDPEQTARFARSALAHLAEQEVGPWLWARWLLALADWLAGRVEQAEPTLAQLLAQGRATAGHHPLVSSCFLLGGVQRARGRLGAALGTYREGLEVATQGGQPSTLHAPRRRWAWARCGTSATGWRRPTGTSPRAFR